MKTKVSKAPFITMLVLALICAIVGGAMLFINPYKGAPVQVSGEIGYVKYEGEYYWIGKIKNVSDKPVAIDGNNFIIELRVEDSIDDITRDISFYGWFDELGGELVLQPNEEYEFDGWEINIRSYEKPTQVREVRYTIIEPETESSSEMRYSYTIYRSTIKGLTSGQVAILMCGFMMAVVFLIISFVVLAQLKNTEKRNVKINEYLAQQETGTVYVGGVLSQAKGKGKAVGKTIASGLGAALSAAFLGVGFYKVYSNGVLTDFVITKEGIFTNDPRNKEINPTRMRLVNKEQLVNPTILQNKRQVILHAGDESKTSFVFNLNNCSTDKETLINTLKDYYNAQLVEGKVK